MEYKKILISDLDGTIIKHHNNEEKRSVLEKDQRSIENFCKDENIFILATGRDIEGVKKFLKYWNFQLNNCYFITSNGAEVYNSDFENIFSQHLSNDIIMEVISRIEKINEGDLIFTIFDGCKEHSFDTFKNDYEQPRFDKVINMFVESKTKDEEKIGYYCKILKEEFGEKIEITQNTFYIDFISKGITKKDGISVITEKIIDDAFKTYSIGDSWNDIPMLVHTDTSYTFFDSPSDVKEAATKIVGYVYECIDDIL